MYSGRQRETMVALYVVSALSVVLALGLALAACARSGSDGTTVADGASATGRSSGELAASDFAPDLNANATSGGPDDGSGLGSSGRGSDGSGSEIDIDTPAGPGGGGSASAGADGRTIGQTVPSAGADPNGTDDETQPEAGGSAEEPVGDRPEGDSTGDESFIPPTRDDGIELVFADGALGPARLGSTIEEIAGALGPLYTVTAEESIRVDFPSGYSIAKAGEVLFWAIEEDGRITVFMTGSPKVGLDSGLRPKLPLADAVAGHGDPTFTIGPEGREFVSFTDGVGGDATLSVLVAVGEFGGPVGVYDSPGEPGAGAETVAYQPENANIKELWFWADG